MSKQSRKPHAEPKQPKLTIPNAAILALPDPALGAAISAFMSQPIPILARMDLRMACDTIVQRAKTLADTHLDLIKQHGGKEEPEGSGSWSIRPSAPGYAAFLADYTTLCAAKTTLPLPGKVRLPAKVLYQGREVDLVMDGAAAALFGEIVEVSR